MAVAIVGRVQGGTEADIEALAKSLMDRWGVGKAACNNGIVLAIAVEDRIMHIATGRGASEYVRDQELSAIVKRMKPLMRATRYADAAEQAVSDIARVLAGASFATSMLSEYGPIVAFLALVFGLIGWKEAKGRKYTRCKKALSQIERERAEARANRYQAVSCPICLEAFHETPSQGTCLLRCGHKFHETCVASWEESRGTCPVCRADTEQGKATHRPRQNIDAYESYDEEYRFRISRARALYPDYVSQRMVDRWSVPRYNGALVADTDFIRKSPSYQDPNARSGRGSGSSSFGGGCSSGGGGAGGSW